MKSKRSKQHARRRIAKQVAGVLAGATDTEGRPFFRMLETKMHEAYVTLGAHEALAIYAKDAK